MFTKFSSADFRCPRITTHTLWLVILVILSTNARAENCNFEKLKFGINQETIKSIYNFDSPDVATTGEATIVSGSPGICKELPESAVVEFTLIDNQFVQLSIVNKNTDNALYNYATKLYGERDNKPNDAQKTQHSNKVKLGLWSKDNEYNVIYKSYLAGKYNIENLIISSNKHKTLFDSANLTKTKAADDYLKDNKLGAYSLNNNGNNSNSTLNDNTKQIQEMTDEIKDLSKTKKIIENENDRGYHYENK